MTVYQINLREQGLHGLIHLDFIHLDLSEYIHLILFTFIWRKLEIKEKCRKISLIGGNSTKTIAMAKKRTNEVRI